MVSEEIKVWGKRELRGDMMPRYISSEVAISLRETDLCSLTLVALMLTLPHTVTL